MWENLLDDQKYLLSNLPNMLVFLSEDAFWPVLIEK